MSTDYMDSKETCRVEHRRERCSVNNSHVLVQFKRNKDERRVSYNQNEIKVSLDCERSFTHNTQEQLILDYDILGQNRCERDHLNSPSSRRDVYISHYYSPCRSKQLYNTCDYQISDCNKINAFGTLEWQNLSCGRFETCRPDNEGFTQSGRQHRDGIEHGLPIYSDYVSTWPNEAHVLSKQADLECNVPLGSAFKRLSGYDNRIMQDRRIQEPHSGAFDDHKNISRLRKQSLDIRQDFRERNTSMEDWESISSCTNFCSYPPMLDSSRNSSVQVRISLPQANDGITLKGSTGLMNVCLQHSNLSQQNSRTLDDIKDCKELRAITSTTCSNDTTAKEDALNSVVSQGIQTKKSPNYKQNLPEPEYNKNDLPRVKPDLVEDMLKNIERSLTAKKIRRFRRKFSFFRVEVHDFPPKRSDQLTAALEQLKFIVKSVVERRPGTYYRVSYYLVTLHSAPTIVKIFKTLQLCGTNVRIIEPLPIDDRNNKFYNFFQVPHPYAPVKKIHPKYEPDAIYRILIKSKIEEDTLTKKHIIQGIKKIGFKIFRTYSKSKSSFIVELLNCIGIEKVLAIEDLNGIPVSVCNPVEPVPVLRKIRSVKKRKAVKPAKRAFSIPANAKTRIDGDNSIIVDDPDANKLCKGVNVNQITQTVCTLNATPISKLSNNPHSLNQAILRNSSVQHLSPQSLNLRHTALEKINALRNTPLTLKFI